MYRKVWTAIVVGSSMAASVSTAHAATPQDVAAAEAAFLDGRTKMDALDYVHACPKFAESLRLEFAVGTILNLAACEEKVGKVASAWQHYRLVVEVAPSDDERHGYADAAARRLDGRVPRLTVVLDGPAPNGLRLTKDDAELSSLALGVALPTDPGLHVVVSRVPGRDDRTFTIMLQEGERHYLRVDVGERAFLSASPPAKANGRRAAGFIVGGAGLASLAVGAYFGVRALSSRADSDAGCANGLCRDDASVRAYDDARSFAHVSDGALIVGALGVAAGAYLLLSGGDAEKRAAWLVTPGGVMSSW